MKTLIMFCSFVSNLSNSKERLSEYSIFERDSIFVQATHCGPIFK